MAFPASASRSEPASDDGLLGAIVRLQQAVSGVLDDIAGAAGITFADYLVLGVVRQAGGRSAPGAIAEILGRTTGGMSLTLDRLESAGWLRRAPDPGDGRRVIVSLTTKGRRLAEDVNQRLHEWESSLDLPVSRGEVRDIVDGVAAAVRGNVT